MIKIEIFGVPYLKKGSGIHIKKKNRGKFTEYCGGEVTDKCIQKAKKSKNPKLRKRATFAANARKWKHEEGAKIHKPDGHRAITDNGWIPTKRLKKGTYGLVKKRKEGGEINNKDLNKDKKPKKKLVVKRQVNPTGMVNKRPIPGLLTNELVAQNTKKNETKK